MFLWPFLNLEKSILAARVPFQLVPISSAVFLCRLLQLFDIGFDSNMVIERAQSPIYLDLFVALAKILHR